MSYTWPRNAGQHRSPGVGDGSQGVGTKHATPCPSARTPGLAVGRCRVRSGGTRCAAAGQAVRVNRHRRTLRRRHRGPASASNSAAARSRKSSTITVSASITEHGVQRSERGQQPSQQLVEPTRLAMMILDRRVHLGPVIAGDLCGRVGAVVGDHPHRRGRHASDDASDSSVAAMWSSSLRAGISAVTETRPDGECSSPRSAAVARPHHGHAEPDESHASPPTHRGPATSTTDATTVISAATTNFGEGVEYTTSRSKGPIDTFFDTGAFTPLRAASSIAAAMHGQPDPEDQSRHGPHEPRGICNLLGARVRVGQVVAIG